MRKFQVLLCFGLFLLCFRANSQVTDLKLSDYKYRTPVYQSLQLNLDLNQNMSTNNEATNMYNRRAFGAGIIGEIHYLRTISTDARQSQRILGASTNSSFFNKKESEVKSNDNFLSGGGVYVIDERRYDGNKFFEFGGSAGISTHSKKTGTAQDNFTDATTQVNMSVYGGVGKGRLEYINDAQTALFILEDLYSSGIIKNKVDKETAMRFAQLITDMKKRRVLDGRRRTIFMLTQIDSFMRSNKIINSCDPKTMAIINDNLFYGYTNDLSGNLNILGEQPGFDWSRHKYDEGFEGLDYGLVPQIEPITDQMFRQQGTIMYARLVPDVFSTSNRTKTTKAGGDSVAKNHFTWFRPTLVVGYENHQAISLSRQKYYKAFLQFEYFKGSEEFILANRKGVELTGIYGLGFYPNNRTVIEGEGMLNLQYYTWGGSKDLGISPGVNFKAGYFLSYNTVLRGSFRIDYNTFTKSKQSFMDELLRIYLVHYFF